MVETDTPLRSDAATTDSPSRLVRVMASCCAFGKAPSRVARSRCTGSWSHIAGSAPPGTSSCVSWRASRRPSRRHRTIIATAAILLATTVHAADSRQHLISDNPDSDNSRAFYHGVTAVAPGVGADLDRYQGIADDNPDLFAVDLGTSQSHESPDIYGPLGAGPDMTY